MKLPATSDDRANNLLNRESTEMPSDVTKKAAC